MLGNVILTVVVSLAVWFVHGHSADAPELTYFASDPIEVTGALGRAEYAQEIAVLNQGPVAAKAVSIKVPRSISSYQLHKHSNLAREASQTGSNSFELLYPELPPDQRIALFVRYDGSPVAREWIAVSDSTGNAKALERQPDPLSPLFLLAIFWSGFVVFQLLDVRRQFADKFIRDADDELLWRNDRPWFAGRGKWSGMQREAIVRALQRCTSLSLENSLAFQLLNRAKPSLMRDADWEAVKAKAVALVMMDGSRKLMQATGKDPLIDLARLRKPELMPWPDWEKLQEAIHERLYDLLLPVRQNAVDYPSLLEPGRSPLADMPDALATEIRGAAQEFYFRQLIRRSTDTWGEPAAVLQTARLDLLNDEQEERLRQHVAQLGRMRKMPRSWEVAELKVFLAEGRPDWMSEQEYLAIGQLVDRIDDLAEEDQFLRSREKRAKADQIEADNLRKKALAQLGLINRVLSSPEAVETLEDYHQVFTPGDIKSLERVAWILRSHRPTGGVANLGKIGAERRLHDSATTAK